ncbi:MAG TPA: PEGA domain-containing protein [Candidatus Paceibacterota bacterium]|jgi:hypothetical protein|nr:PEGA domain-containing protein [Candidatus Paceibacterota bacterium]
MISKLINIKLYIIFLTFATLSSTSAQNKKISIHTNIDSAFVFIDNQFIGYTPINDFIISKDTINLLITDENVLNWSSQKINENIIVNKDTSIFIYFKHKVYVNTLPDNAEIIFNDKSIGKSPLFILYDNTTINKIEIKKENYHSLVLKTDSTFPKTISLKLQELNTDQDKNLKKIKSNNNLNEYLIIGGIISGIISGYSKMRADHYEAEYYNNKTNTNKEKVYLYDTISNISLIIFECSLISISYLLLKD